LTTSLSAPPSGLGCPPCRHCPVRLVDDAGSVTSGDGLSHTGHPRCTSETREDCCRCVSVFRPVPTASLLPRQLGREVAGWPAPALHGVIASRSGYGHHAARGVMTHPGGGSGRPPAGAEAALSHGVGFDCLLALVVMLADAPVLGQRVGWPPRVGRAGGQHSGPDSVGFPGWSYLGAAPLGVGTGRRVIAQPGQDDQVQGLVELTVPRAIQPHAHRLAAGGRDGRGPPSMAKAASVRQRPAWDQALRTMAATIGPRQSG